MKVSHAIKVLKNLPQDWTIMWGDTRQILHNIVGVSKARCSFHYDENFSYCSDSCDPYVETILFENREDGEEPNEEVKVADFVSRLSGMPQDTDLLFRNFIETSNASSSFFIKSAELLPIRGFRRAKYTEYDFNISRNKKYHYVRMMLFNDDLDKKS